MSTAPNVVVVVLDCVRSDDLGGAGPTSPQLPTLQRLRSESVGFPKTASVSHWTLPSHASIFSGVYPWTHGLYQGGRSVLSGEIPLMARWLARAGYRTGAFNSNGLLNPSFGWLDGFEYAGWGSSAYLRSSGATRPPHELGTPEGSPKWRESIPELLRRATYWGVVGLERFPLLLDRVARAESRWRGGGGYSRPVLSPWIDHTLPRWLSTVPADEPAFAFVNLMDAHEPYLMDREDGFTRKDLSDASRVRQDHHGWIEGHWQPSARESELLHRLYRGSLRLLDARVARIVASLKAAGRWENTMFVLTSDHGQAFGRDGVLYHMLGISDELLRVPLWVRYPGGVGGGASARGWASLIDIPATVAEVTGAPAPTFTDAVSLSNLVREERPRPVFAIADGATFGDASEHVAPSRLNRYDFRAVAGYQGRWKGVLSVPDGRARFFDIESDPLEERPQEAPVEARPLLEELQQVAARFGSSPRLGESTADRRLRAWGYAD